MRLKSPGAINQAFVAVSECIRGWENLSSVMGNIPRAKRDYVQWVDLAYAKIDNEFWNSELAAGFFSNRYWQIVQLGDYSDHLLELIRREQSSQVSNLKSAQAKLEEFRRFAARTGHIVVPDTSAFLQGIYFKDFDWTAGVGLAGPTRIVVPILVVEELDKVKSFERGKGRDRARQVLKDLREIMRTVEPNQAAQLRSNVTVEILVDDDWHERRANNDGEIIDQALLIRDLISRGVLLVCVDAAMEFRARQHGLNAAAMPEPNEE